MPLLTPLSSVGLQLYTVRALMQADVRSTLELVSSVGYREVEFASTYGIAPSELRAWLDEFGLVSPAGHLDKTGFETDLSGALDRAEILGQRYLLLPWLPEGDRTRDGYLAIAALLNQASTLAMERRSGWLLQSCN
jgi:hypothetical protein